MTRRATAAAAAAAADLIHLSKQESEFDSDECSTFEILYAPITQKGDISNQKTT